MKIILDYKIRGSAKFNFHGSAGRAGHDRQLHRNGYPVSD